MLISWSEQRVRLESCEVDVMTPLHCVCVAGGVMLKCDTSGAARVKCQVGQRE